MHIIVVTGKRNKTIFQRQDDGALYSMKDTPFLSSNDSSRATATLEQDYQHKSNESELNQRRKQQKRN